MTSSETLQANRILSAKSRSTTPQEHAKEATRIAKLRHKAEDSVNQLVVDHTAMELAQSMTTLVAAGRYDAISADTRPPPGHRRPAPVGDRPNW